MRGSPGGMKLRHRIVLMCAALLFALFLIGKSDSGQQVLRGKPKPNETHFEADDRYMGAGLAPFVYCLAPGTALFIYGVADILVYRLRRKASS
jgi:hypothetical protein